MPALGKAAPVASREHFHFAIKNFHGDRVAVINTQQFFFVKPGAA
jgi:hypothetical protein